MRENNRDQVTTGFAVLDLWKWHEVFKPIAKRNIASPK